MTKDSGKVLIHGKEYETVASRVQKFKVQYGLQCSIETELISADENVVIMKATIKRIALDDPHNTAIDPVVVATGHAEENRQSSQINRTSALENCETSAIGRALAAFGLAGTEFASADEVAQAISQQGTRDFPEAKQQLTGLATDKQRETIARHLKSVGISEEDQKDYLIEQFAPAFPLDKQTASEIIDALFAK